MAWFTMSVFPSVFTYNPECTFWKFKFQRQCHVFSGGCCTQFSGWLPHGVDAVPSLPWQDAGVEERRVIGQGRPPLPALHAPEIPSLPAPWTIPLPHRGCWVKSLPNAMNSKSHYYLQRSCLSWEIGWHPWASAGTQVLHPSWGWGGSPFAGLWTWVWSTVDQALAWPLLLSVLYSGSQRHFRGLTFPIKLLSVH